MKNQRAVYENVNISDDLVYEWVRFFKGQVYEWGRFEILARTPVPQLYHNQNTTRRKPNGQFLPKKWPDGYPKLKLHQDIYFFSLFLSHFYKIDI